MLLDCDLKAPWQVQGWGRLRALFAVMASPALEKPQVLPQRCAAGSAAMAASLCNPCARCNSALKVPKQLRHAMFEQSATASHT